jgi:glycosyltransferase involved in cell wall biosynthesis
LRVLFIGALSAEKDPATALAALAAAPEDVVLRFVGDGALRADLEGEVARRGLGPRVEFTGAVADVAPHLGWAGCLILTSRTEGLPGVVLESAAAGLPVIAADVGGVGDAVVHDVTGLLVPPGDPARFAAAIARLAADPDLRASMGEAGRRHVEAAFLLDRSLDRFDMLLRQTMEAAR